MTNAVSPGLEAIAALRGKTVLITGASGFIGTHLAQRLSTAGVDIVCLDLLPPRAVLEGAKYVTGDVRDLSGVELPKVDVIFNLAAVHTTPGHPDHEYYDTNVNGALEVVRVAERDGVKSVVFTSSISVYGPSEERKTEASKPSPTSAYGKSKLMAEKIQEAWVRGGGDRKLVVVRPAVVFGAGEGGNFTRMAKLLKKGLFVFPGRRDTIKSCIYVEDLIDLVLKAFSLDNTHTLLNGSYPECPSLETIVYTLKQDYFPAARMIDLPAGVVITAAKSLSALNGFGLGVHPDRVTKLMRSTHVFPDWGVQNGMFSDRTFSRGIAKWAEQTAHTFI